ncbi:hypothetical protein V497_05872 [Pseudogymnoascus sp. VKM F-4516 (FW-969)]|nr:hypothetical protein V497_05872 [Pseudogymnoascus sp. VKM F-4516 (FW-969)]
MRYTRDELEHLRDSPLVVRPVNLPPAEEYMGPPETERKPNTRERRGSAGFPDQAGRRPGVDKLSRGPGTPLDIILGPPKTSFASSTSARNARPSDAAERQQDQDPRDRHPFRKSDGESDRTRDNQRQNLRPRRSDADQDSDGWSTVKPRKSFGADGAERFNGRMGGERHRDDPPMPRRGSRDARDGERERPARGFETFSRDRDAIKEQAEEVDGAARRGFGRGRTESWFKDKEESAAAAAAENRKSNGERLADRSRGWREKDTEKTNGRAHDRNADRNNDRERGGDRDDRGGGRWDRDNRRQDREPEWMDEPSDSKKRAHTQEDFQKWKESMNAGIMKTPAAEVPPSKSAPDAPGQSSFFGFDKPKVETPVVIDPGPDRFMSMWSTPKPEGAETPLAVKKEGPVKATTAGKASRFTSFFAAPQEDTQRRQTEPVPPVPGLALKESNPQSDKEKEDFQKLLLKLQSQSLLGMKTPTPPVNLASQPKPPPQQKPMDIQLPPLDQFQQYRPGFQEPPRPGSREPQSQQAALQDLLGNRSTAISQPASRPEPMVHDLANQRQNTASQGSSRPDQDINRNAAFLMGLMQAPRQPDQQLRQEQLMMRPPQSQPQRQQQHLSERDQDLLMREQRERAAQRQRQELPPGFFDESFLARGSHPQQQQEPRPNSQQQQQQQPTQILQRPPPGLEQLPPGWPQQPREQQQQQLPQSMPRHPLQPPPGLAGGPSRGMPLPPMFPPGFPMQGYGPPPPESLMSGGGGAQRNAPPPPPPGFMGPPPGFMPPPIGFPGEMGYAPSFDGRGPPPPQQGGFRR